MCSARYGPEELTGRFETRFWSDPRRCRRERANRRSQNRVLKPAHGRAAEAVTALGQHGMVSLLRQWCFDRPALYAEGEAPSGSASSRDRRTLPVPTLTFFLRHPNGERSVRYRG